MPDLSSQDLGNGYRLVFQTYTPPFLVTAAPHQKVVRAVVKDVQGNITARGLIVPEADAEVSKRMVLMEHMAAHMAPPAPVFTDFDSMPDGPVDDEDDIGAEADEEDFS